MEKLSFLVPPGIGDISWVYSKVCELAKVRKVEFTIAASYLNRSITYVSLLPNIVNLGYGQQGWPYPHLDKDVDLSILDSHRYGLTANPFLEAGVKLADIWPKQATNYHYEMNLPDHAKANDFIAKISGRPRIGLYASGHFYGKAFWEVADLMVLVCKLFMRYPDAALYFVGANWDDKTKDVAAEAKRLGFNVAECIAQFDIGDTVNVIKRFDYFFLFNAGLGMLSDVVGTPVLMWYPHRGTDAFINTYADPVNVANGRHLNILVDSVDKTWRYFLDRGEQWLLQRMNHAE